MLLLLLLLLLLLPFFRHFSQWETLLRVDWPTWRACNYLLVLACSLTLSKPTFGLCAGAILPDRLQWYIDKLQKLFNCSIVSSSSFSCSWSWSRFCIISLRSFPCSAWPFDRVQLDRFLPPSLLAHNKAGKTSSAHCLLDSVHTGHCPHWRYIL